MKTILCSMLVLADKFQAPKDKKALAKAKRGSGNGSQRPCLQNAR
jgi:hypothetical protein